MSGNATGRVVALIVLLFLTAAALRGYLPPPSGGQLADAGGGKVAMTILVASLAGTLAMMAFAIIARLRDPRTVAPSAGELSRMLGGRPARPSWRVILIGLAVILAWLLVAFALSRIFQPYELSPPEQQQDSNTTTSVGAPATTTPPKQSQNNDSNRGVLQILLASSIPLALMVIAGAAVAARRRAQVAPDSDGASADDDLEPPPPQAPSDSLVRAAEVGLAEMADRRRDPREAIIACYAAMERELATVPGAAPQDCDTPSEVLARAVGRRALHGDNAAQLVNLFVEARFSPHVMTEAHREEAVRILQLVRAELAGSSRSRA